jgi:hypothetical protein
MVKKIGDFRLNRHSQAIHRVIVGEKSLTLVIFFAFSKSQFTGSFQAHRAGFGMRSIDMGMELK